MKVYLGGPINGCSDDEANGWRDGFRALLPDCEFIDPMVRDYRGREDDSVREIVEFDKKDINDADVVLAYCWQASWGTAMEIFYAWEHGRTVVVVVPEGARVSPWLRYHSNTVLSTLADAARYIDDLSDDSFDAAGT